jgi:hypothetical protein
MFIFRSQIFAGGGGINAFYSPFYQTITIDNSHYRLIIHLGQKKYIPGKSILKLVKLQKNTKFANFARLYIFRILQYFATKLCNFTHFSMRFLAVTIYLHLLA